ncbi:ionic transporter y4hA [Erythrobacteraceae bacterium CFH 75059]|uniref:calcium:proton antiporter n=1 Tax=Qipengyuania thermophila TaxID=2509361 RepID=UPI00101F4D31|nr:ionic transporter y4hA [Qipengyuania thermophila]TCD06490.1 ionic transporter y4hA [Erythrobacteraceae bacterium CFH 75059]
MPDGSKKPQVRLPSWSLLTPIVGIAASLAGLAQSGSASVAVLAAVLIGSVIAAVHHAEVIALRIGEPFGTLVLALAVTVIESSLIVSLMLSNVADASTLARDTVVAAIMIILTGMLGACFFVGGLRHREQRFTREGVSAGLSTLAALAVLVLILPNYTVSEPGASYAPSQLVFVSVVTFVLYITFVMVQTLRHRTYFLPAEEDITVKSAPPPSGRLAVAAFVALIAALTAVILLAQALASPIERAVVGAGLPLALVAVLIAGVVLAPEGTSAVRAARRNRLQTSVNLAFGSALATIGLTIPTVAMVSLVFDLPLALGVSSKAMTLLALSLFVTAVSLSTGRTTVLHGMVHLVIFAVYLFTTIVP